LVITPIMESNRITKVADAIAALVLIIVTLPLLLIVALAIKIESRGPVLLREHLRGRNDRRVSGLKFRTAIFEAGQDGQDPQLTTIGRWLRYSRMEDLPQLINVLRGDMTLIGHGPGRAQFLE
jgi:lipopolysaccharide/colanic/teichoic acid biosynthesis glycosyltransferase